MAEAGLFLPIGADRIVLRPGRHDRLRVCVRLSEPATGSTFAANVLIKTAEGEPVVSIEHMRFARADRSTITWARNDNDLYTINWMPASNLPSGEPVSPRGVWIVFADIGGIADAIAAEIEAAGGSCHLVRVGGAFAQVAERRWVIDPANPGDYRWLFEELGWAGHDVPGRRRPLLVARYGLRRSDGARPARAGRSDRRRFAAPSAAVPDELRVGRTLPEPMC